MFMKYYLKYKPKYQILQENKYQKLQLVFMKLLKQLQNNFYIRCIQRRYRRIGIFHIYSFYFKRLWFEYTNKCIYNHQLDKVALNHCKFEKFKKYFNNWIVKISKKKSKIRSINNINDIGILRRFSFISRWIDYIDFQKLQAWQIRQDFKIFNSNLCYKYLKQFKNSIKQKKLNSEYINYYYYIFLNRLRVDALSSFLVFVDKFKHLSYLNKISDKYRANNQYRQGFMSFIMYLVKKREINNNKKIHIDSEIILKKSFKNWIRSLNVKSICNESFTRGMRTNKILNAIKSINKWKYYSLLVRKKSYDYNNSIVYFKILKYVGVMNTFKQVFNSNKMQIESLNMAYKYYLLKGFTTFSYQHFLSQKFNFISRSSKKKGINYYRLNCLNKYFNFFYNKTIEIIKYKSMVLKVQDFRRVFLLKLIFNGLLNNLIQSMDLLIIASNFFKLYTLNKAFPKLRYCIQNNHLLRIKNNENVKVGLFMYKYRKYTKIFQYLRDYIDYKQEKIMWCCSIILKLNSFYYKKYFKLLRKFVKKKKRSYNHSIIDVINNYNYRYQASSFALFKYNIRQRLISKNYEKETKICILNDYFKIFKKLIHLNSNRKKKHKKDSFTYMKRGLNSYGDLRYSNQRSLSIIATKWRLNTFLSGLFIKFLRYKLNCKYYINKQLNKLSLRKLSKSLLYWYIYCEHKAGKRRQISNLNLFYNRNSKIRGLSNCVNYLKNSRSIKLVVNLLQKKYISIWSIKLQRRTKLKNFINNILINKNMNGIKKLFFNEWKENIIIENQVDLLILQKNKKKIIKFYMKLKENCIKRIKIKKKLRKFRGKFVSKSIHNVFGKLSSIFGKRKMIKLKEYDVYQYYINYIRIKVFEYFHLFKKKLNSKLMCKKYAGNRFIKNLINYTITTKLTKSIMSKSCKYILKKYTRRLMYFKSIVSTKKSKLIILKANKYYMSNKSMKFLLNLEKYLIYQQNLKKLNNISKNYLNEKLYRESFKLLLYNRRKCRKVSKQYKSMISYSNNNKLRHVLKKFDFAVITHFSHNHMMRLMNIHSVKKDLTRGLRAFILRRH